MATIDTQLDATTKPNSPEPIVRFTDIKYCYKSSQKHFHLGPMSIQIPQGDVLSILGPSGSGKTTFLRLIAGLAMPEAGSIVIDGRTVFDARTKILPETAECRHDVSGSRLVSASNRSKEYCFRNSGLAERRS